MLVLYLILAISVLKSFNVFRRARRAVCSLAKCRKRRIRMSTRDDEDHGLRLKQFETPTIPGFIILSHHFDLLKG